jgi:hypothetical protein
MTDKQAPQSPSDADNPIILNSSTSEYVGEVESNDGNSKCQKKECSNKEHSPVNNKADFHADKDSYKSPSNVLQTIFLIVNIILAIYTIKLFYQTKESVRIANDALSDSRINDSLSKTQYTPYLQAGNFRYVNDTTLAYSIFNLTQYPAKILGVQFAPGAAGSINPLAMQTQVSGDSSKAVFAPVHAPLSENVYVIKESPVEMSYTGYYPKINEKGGRLYGRIYYMNEITLQYRLYSFSVFLSGTNSKISHQFHNNENINTKIEHIPTIVSKYEQ